MEGKPAVAASAADVEQEVQSGRYRRLTPFWERVMLVATLAATALAVNQIFNLGFGIGEVLLDGRYLYIVTGLMLAMVFIAFPAGHYACRDRVPWYDLLIIAVICINFGYFAWNAERIILEAWEYIAPPIGIWLSLATWLIVLEAGRRAGGWPIFVIVGILSLYPLYSDKMPDVVAGIGMGLPETAIFHVLSEESLFGIPMQAFGLLVFGFLLFGVALRFTGGGPFFINFAFALLGHFRGGPAKVAIFSSGLMGSMSGGPVTNALTTGPLSIPAMRRIGFSRQYAAGVEACASTGGVLMPPIMGATAFVMANFLGISYVEVALAAVIPSLLYFFGLFMQIDAYAARHELHGLPRAELPSVGRVFREGWYFIFVFVLLILLLVYMQREATAPFLATALLLVINQCTQHRLSWARFREMVTATGQLMAELAGILAAIGLIVGSLAVTGMAGTLANDLVYIAGDNVVILLLMGAITSFVLGIGMTVTAAYIFLAIVLAPALVSAGLDPLASHMFIMYWGMLSFITPPVALAAFAAASVAQVPPMQAGLQAMRLGTIIYFIPFFFVFNPALLMQGGAAEILTVLGTAMLGVALVSAALQGYLIGLGRLGEGWTAWVARTALFVGGLLLAAPGGGMLGLSHVALLMSGVVLVAVAVALVLASRDRA